METKGDLVFRHTEEEHMAEIPTGRRLRVWLAERRSPIPYNSWEVGCSVEDTVPDLDEAFQAHAKRLAQLAEQGLDIGREILMRRLDEDLEKGDV